MHKRAEGSVHEKAEVGGAERECQPLRQYMPALVRQQRERVGIELAALEGLGGDDAGALDCLDKDGVALLRVKVNVGWAHVEARDWRVRIRWLLCQLDREATALLAPRRERDRLAVEVLSLRSSRDPRLTSQPERPTSSRRAFWSSSSSEDGSESGMERSRTCICGTSPNFPRTATPDQFAVCHPALTLLSGQHEKGRGPVEARQQAAEGERARGVKKGRLRGQRASDGIESRVGDVDNKPDKSRTTRGVEDKAH
jgi:hypothetical protein